MLGLVDNVTDFGGPVDLLGQGTWKYTKDRQKWAIWSSLILSSDTLLLTAPAKYDPTPPCRATC